MPRPLEGIRVVDWTIWQQGPVASAMLADLGAEVIKVESRDGGDPGRGLVAIQGTAVRANFYFEGLNRGKQSLALDLKKPEAREILYRLVAKSDVFVQNFRKGVAERLGLGYDDLRRHNERIIYASATGYGPEGPDSGEPSFDHLGLARSGIMFATGEPDMGPMAVGGGVADQMGAVMLAYGVLAALYAREKLGVGQKVDTSHLGSMAWLQGLSMSSRLINGAAFPRVARKRASNPLWNHYECQDGKWIALAMLQSDRYWADFAKAIGRPALANDERYRDLTARAVNAEACVAELDAAFASKPRDEWMRILKAGGDFIYTIVNSLDDLPTDPQMVANHYVTELDHPSVGKVQYLDCPVTFSATPGGVREVAPELGQHTELLMTELLGYSWDDVGALRDKGVI
ncbi:MAG: CoA transferase [Myxococcota bacterium]|nr:CoA transferase [Myxococcales bacterium]